MNINKGKTKTIFAIFLLWVLASPVPLSHAIKYKIVELGIEGTQSSAWALNDRGQIVIYQDHTILLYDKGSITNVTELYNLDSGYYGPNGFAINNRGQIVTNDSDGNAVRMSRMIVDNLNTLNAPLSTALGINDAGQVVGEYWDNEYFPSAFLYQEGEMKDLGTGKNSGANAVNESGMIVGWYAPEGHYQTFLFFNGVIKNISPFGSQQSLGYDINNRGQVVGEFLTEDGSAIHAFLYDKGVATDLGLLSGSYSTALAINDRGDIVGSSSALVGTEIICPPNGHCRTYPKYSDHAFLYRQGVLSDLNNFIPGDSGWELIAAYDINNRGQIVGVGYYNGEQRGFLLTPATGSERIKR